MPKNVSLSLSFILLLASCKIEGSFAGLYSCYGKAKQTNAALFVETDTSTSICGLRHEGDPRVYLINGKQLKDCISEEKEAVVYIWKPRCQSQFCYSLNVIQSHCDSFGRELFVVAEYYDAETMGLRYNIERPVFGINTKHYHTDLTSKYVSRFLNDAAGQTKKQGNLFWFKNGVLIKTAYNLKELYAVGGNVKS